MTRSPGQRPQDSRNHANLDHEKKLLLRFKQDPREYDRIMSTYGADILGYVDSLVQDRELARELTHQTFVRAFSGLLVFEWRGLSPAALLFRIARNEVGRWARDRQYTAGSEHRLAGLKARRADSPDHRLQVKDERGLLQSFLARLEPPRSEVFDLYYWRGLRVWEVSRVMGLSEALVKAHLRRGRADLKLAMQEEGLDLQSFGTLLGAEEGEMG